MKPIIIVPNGIKEITLTIEEFKKYIQDAYNGGYADAKKEAFKLGDTQRITPITDTINPIVITCDNGKSASWLESNY